jgi:hypothetical protein
LIALQIESSTITRCRLAARIKDSLPYGGIRALAAEIGVNEIEVSRALSRPDQRRSVFERIAAHVGFWPNPNVDGQFSRKQRDPIRGGHQHEVEPIVAAFSLDTDLNTESDR